jgi:hypothetical protein
MPRYFSLDEAQRVIPRVERAVRAAIDLKAEYQRAEDSLRAFSRKLMVSGGMIVDREKVAGLQQSRVSSAERLQSAMQEIEAFGCLVKDLDIGLLDFLTLYRGREVCLCWRLGETAIEFWHGVDEGFGGRKPIDDDFRANHSGDQVS